MSLTKKAQQDIIKTFKTHFSISKPAKIEVDPHTHEVNVEAKIVRLQVPGQIPVKLGTVKGYLDLGECELTDLHNCAHTVTGTFWCHKNHLTTLVDGPQHVGRDYVCGNNLLQDFTGLPADFTGTVNALSRNPDSLATLKNLHGIPPSAARVEVSYTPDLPLLSLLQYSSFYIGNPPINYPHDITEIFHRYWKTGRKGAIPAAIELIKAGYKGNAKW